MPFISYAQNYEDVMLWRALHDVERGFYVDVGAADPEVHSVTHAFYERGWSGINVEPVDEYFDKLQQARPRDANLKVAVGREPGVRTLHAIAGTGLSTFDPQTAARHQAAGLQACETLVPVLTLKTILEDCPAPAIHFLKIDVEGAEAEVLEGLSLDRVRPWIIVVEATEPNSTVSSRSRWEQFVTGCGYCFAYFDGLNCFYVADERSELKESFVIPPNLFDDFMLWTEWSALATLQQERSSAQALEGALRNALSVEQAQVADLNAQVANLNAQIANLKAQIVNLNDALESAWSHADQLNGVVRQLQAQLAVPSIDRALGRVLRRLQETGDRLTGGGIRALNERVLTKILRRK
jgi:FkbM family methyltransferase